MGVRVPDAQKGEAPERALLRGRRWSGLTFENRRFTAARASGILPLPTAEDDPLDNPRFGVRHEVARVE